METKHLEHKAGGKITVIEYVAHETYKGVASWHFIGSVVWSDGKKSDDIQISPISLCFDQTKPEAKAECDAVLKALNDYILEAGEWHEPKHKRDGRVYSWTPREKNGHKVI